MKNKTVFYAPVDTFSGYGDRARGVVKSIYNLKKDEWDIKVIPCRWGNTPNGFLQSNKEWHWMIPLLINQLTEQPDYFFSITVSNEFQPVGKYNIGISALVETDVLPADMLEGLNRMNLNLVSSNHSKTIATYSTFDKLDNNTKQKVGEIKLNKPVEVLFEGIDTKVYQSKDVEEFDLSFVEEEFCFLIVGHLLPGTKEMEDRKNIGLTIKTFLETFKNKKNKPALVLKSSMGGYSYMDEEATLNLIDGFIKSSDSNDLPNIYLIHGELEESELNGLYNNPKVKAYITAGNEGFGRPELEFSAATGKPVIASPYGGHLDFLDKELNVFVGGSMTPVHQSVANQFLLKEAKLFKPDVTQLSLAMTDIFENYKKYTDIGKRQGYRSRTEFSFDKMTEKLDELLKANLPKISVPVPISLPKLKKLELTTT